jgi:MFS family permease
MLLFHGTGTVFSVLGNYLNIIYVDPITTPLAELRNTVNESMKQQPLLSYCYHVRWKLMEGFRSLKGSPTELWLCYFLKFLQSYSYYSFSLICVMFLSHDFHYSDLEAGAIYGFGGGLVTFWGFVAGYLIDTIGVASALKAGCAITLFSRVWVFRTTNRMALLFNLWFLLPMGCCLGLPVLATGVRRYTHLKNRSFAFALFHVVMNLAVLASGLVFDLCTLLYLPNKPIAAVPLQQLAVLDSSIASNVTAASKSLIVGDVENVWYLSSYRLILLTGIAANVVSCVATLGVREIKVECDKVQYLDNEEDNTEQTLNSREVVTFLNDETEALRTLPQKSQKVVSFTPTRAKGLQLLCETLRSSNFWRLLVVCFATVSVRMIFRHVDATLPKYLEREFGDKTLKGTVRRTIMAGLSLSFCWLRYIFSRYYFVY